MRLEVHSAADFLMNLLRVKQAKNSLPENQLQHFKGSLQSLLVLRFRSHWYPDVPTKGSGYRCIRINGKMDPIVEQAGVAVGLLPRTLRKMLPSELTLWIDPEEVSYRIGENGSICVLYDSQSRASPSSDLDSTGSGGMSGEEFVMERVGKLDLTDLQLMDFLENKNRGRSPTKQQLQPHHQQKQRDHKNVQRLNNSLGSSDDISPPLSPPYQLNTTNNRSIHHQQQQQQQHHNNHHLYNNNNGGSPGAHHVQHPINVNFMESGHLFHWEGFSSSNNNNSNTVNNKVRTQC